MWEPFPLLKFPALQAGGQIVGTGLALLHRGETVVPAGARMGGGVTLNVTLPNYLGDKAEVARVLVDEINRNQKIGRMRFAT
jgi:hypothetical protein